MSSQLDVEDDWSHGPEKLLDQMLHSRVYMFPFNIPLKLRDKIKFSLRTAWSVFLTIFLMQWWQWSPIALYLSPVITIIASSMYFGLWQENFYNMSYGVVIGTAIGVLIGLSYKITPLHIVLLFIALTWINRMPTWDRLTQILSSLSMILGAVWPVLTNGSVVGLKSFVIVLSINFIPYLITGFSLLFPRLSLATYRARFQALLVCRKLTSMIVAVVKGFFSYDDVDVCLAEFDQHHSEVVADLATLKSLARHVDYERIVFRSVQHLPASLMVFIEISELIVQELLGIRDMMKKISFNTTHSKFATHLKPFLVDLAVEMEISLSMIGEHFDSFDPLRGVIPASLRQGASDLCKCRLYAEHRHATRHRMSRFYEIPKSSELLHSYNQYKSSKSDEMQSNPAHPDSRDEIHHYSLTKVDLEDGQTACDDEFSGQGESQTVGDVSSAPTLQSIELLFSRITERLSVSRNALLYEFTEVRRDFLQLQADVSSSSRAHTVLSTPSHIENIVPMINLVEEEKHLIDERQRLLSSLDDFSHTLHTEDEVLRRDIDVDIAQSHLLKLSIREETMRLSLRNVGARIAYMHRLSILVEYIATYRHVLARSGHPFNLFAFAYSVLLTLLNYFIETIAFWRESFVFFQHEYQTKTNLAGFAQSLRTAFVSTYGKGIKVSIAATIGATLMLYKAVPFLYQGGLWMTLVTILIKQDLASSSFLTSVQRLEGTVVGAMYAFLVYQIFSCDSSKCDGWIEIPSLVIWVAVCGLFRTGPQHGYSATVASFTPILLLLGTVDTKEGAWGRIEETFLGIAIYLAVDNLILPQRTYPAVKASVISCIDSARYIFSESVKGVEILVKIENSYSTDTGGQWAFEAGATQKDDMGMYGAAADVRLRSDSVTYEIMEGSYKHRKLSSVSLLSTSSTEGGIETTPAAQLTDASAPKLIQELLENCSQHFHDSEQKLRSMKTELTKQATLLNLVQYEPELWHRSFPQAAYQRLLDNFQRVYRSGVALNSGSKAFTVILCQMMRRNENISHHLSHFKFMISHLFLVSAKSDEALQKAHEAFKLLYAKHDGGGENVDASSLLSLRRVCDKLFEAVDDHFRTVYMRLPPEALITFNPYFLAAWQNVFESAQDLIRDLSDLGITLLAVRNVESLVTL